MNARLINEKNVIIKNIIIAILVTAFFVGIIMTFYNMLYEEKRSNIIKDGEMSARQAADSFEKYLSINRDSLKLTAYTLDNMIMEKRTDSEIQDYLVGQSTAIKSAVNENSTGLYGYINGRFFSGTLWEPPEGYDATERPWYIKPMSNSGMISMLDPYLDLESGNVMLALGKTLCDAVSVVSVDVSLDKIQRIAENAVAADNADIEMILNDKGFVVAHSDKNENGKNYGTEKNTLGSEIVRRLNEEKSSSFEFTYNNLHYIVYAAELQDGWRCVSVMDATAVFSPLNMILSLTIAAVFIVIVIIAAIMTASSRRQLIAEKLSTQLSSTADIYISLHEIDLLSDTYSVVRNSNPAVASVIASTHGNCREIMNAAMKSSSAPETRESIMDFCDLTKLDHRLRDRNTMTAEFMSVENRWRRARFIVSGRTPSGRVARVMFLVEDIDAEKRNRDTTLGALKLINEQMSSVANIYISMYDINLPADTFCEIRTQARNASDLMEATMEHAQATIRSVMEQMTDESSLSAISDFIDLSTLNERIRNTNTITEEFLSSKNIWSRARFVVSKRAANGDVEHVLWLVESIDAEKRKRDDLTKVAETLNQRISSIADIFMTAHEIDIENDTFIALKSDSEMVTNIIGNKRTHAQAVINKVMMSVTDESSIDEVIRFVDLSSLPERLANINTITIEYMIKQKLWRRGRFVASRRDANGRLTHVLWLAEDIDNEKQERKDLIDKSERAIAANKAKSSFLTYISRNIRTPINTMLGMNEMILRESDNEDILSYADTVQSSGATLLALINDILDISKIETGKMEIVPTDYDLRNMVDDLISMTKPDAKKKGLKLTADVSSDIPRALHGDEAHIKQVLMNLLSNAVKYTNKGSVTLCIEYEKMPDEPNSIMLEFSVKDTGIGMKKEVCERLLSGTESNEGSEAGAGLGIGITNGLLHMMNSELMIDSVFGLGSRFRFKLKQTISSDSEKIGLHSSSRARSGENHHAYHEKFRAPKANILVVDDSSIGVKLIRELLKKTEVKIDSVLTGDEALMLTRSKKFDIIFLDQMMPNKSGIETLKEIRGDKYGANIGTPVICITADAVSGAREHYIRSGFDNYITKPIDPGVLEEMLLSYLPADLIMSAVDTGENTE